MIQISIFTFVDRIATQFLLSADRLCINLLPVPVFTKHLNDHADRLK